MAQRMGNIRLKGNGDVVFCFAISLGSQSKRIDETNMLDVVVGVQRAKQVIGVISDTLTLDVIYQWHPV